jgi:catecholate siderophore receptor
MNDFQGVTGLRVVLSNPEIASVPSPGVSGVYTAEQALKRILTGTGVNYRISADTVTLDLAGPSESIIVAAPSTVSSPKYTAPLTNVPQTITVIPKTVIEQQGATTLRDVLRNVSGLTMTAGEGGTPAGDNLTLRGFSARNDVFVDNVRDLGPQSRDPFNLEQVEVVKGPSSAYSGRGSTGGTINLVSKAPSLSHSIGGTLNLGTDRMKRVTADVTLPLENLGLGKRTGFRLNFLAHDSGVAGRDEVANERWGIAPSVAFGIGSQTRVTLNYFRLKQDNLSDYGIPWVPATNNVLRDFRDKPAPVPRNTFYGLKSRDHEGLGSDMATVRVERDFNESFTLRNQFRYGRSTRDSIATPPRFASNDSTTINRELRSWITDDTIWDNQTDLRANFSTLKIDHTLVSGVVLTKENNLRQNRSGPNMPTTLLNPNPNDTYTGAIIVSPIVGDITGESVALYAFDTVKVTPKFELNGGLRWDDFGVDGVNTASARVTRIDRMLSWRAGVVFKPSVNGSFYTAYGTSLNPSLEGLSYVTANTAIDPEKTYNLEFGSKWDFFRNRLSLTGAAFRVDKTNARTPGLLPDDPPQVLQGSQRVNGLELSATGSLTHRWNVFAGYTLLDSEIRNSNNLAEIGKRLQNTPKNSFNLWTTYELPRRVTLGWGARFTDQRFGNNTNTRDVGSYWLVDAMGSFPVTKHVDLRVNLYNLTNSYYFDRLGGGHLIPGPARAVSTSTTLRF